MPTEELTLAEVRMFLWHRPTEYPAPWECQAVVTERRALEQARDRLPGHLADPERRNAFDAALDALDLAEYHHVRATGCTDRH